MTSYYFIRHAEKDPTDPTNKDPALSELGVRRAEKWAKVFRDVAFDLILSTAFKRTRRTAEVIADSQKIPVEIYEPRGMDISGFHERAKGKTVLVVGHTNTIPVLVNQLLKEKKYEYIPENESGSLHLVTISTEGEGSSQVLYFN